MSAMTDRRADAGVSAYETQFGILRSVRYSVAESGRSHGAAASLSAPAAIVLATLQRNRQRVPYVVVGSAHSPDGTTVGYRRTPSELATGNGDMTVPLASMPQAAPRWEQEQGNVADSAAAENSRDG